jgi:hypothetical protein
MIRGLTSAPYWCADANQAACISVDWWIRAAVCSNGFWRQHIAVFVGSSIFLNCHVLKMGMSPVVQNEWCCIYEE